MSLPLSSESSSPTRFVWQCLYHRKRLELVAQSRGPVWLADWPPHLKRSRRWKVNQLSQSVRIMTYIPATPQWTLSWKTHVETLYGVLNHRVKNNFHVSRFHTKNRCELKNNNNNVTALCRQLCGNTGRSYSLCTLKCSDQCPWVKMISAQSKERQKKFNLFSV